MRRVCSVYELFVSLGDDSDAKSYDMYTAVVLVGAILVAVGITSGLAAVDRDARDKARR